MASVLLRREHPATSRDLWRAWAPRYMHSRSAPPYSTVRLGRPGIAAISRMQRSAGHARGASDSSASANAPPLRNSDVFSSISCERGAGAFKSAAITNLLISP